MNVGESDRLVTLFTRENGIIRAFASGAKNIKSKRVPQPRCLHIQALLSLKRRIATEFMRQHPLQCFFRSAVILKPFR